MIQIPHKTKRSIYSWDVTLLPHHSPINSSESLAFVSVNQKSNHIYLSTNARPHIIQYSYTYVLKNTTHGKNVRATTRAKFPRPLLLFPRSESQFKHRPPHIHIISIRSKRLPICARAEKTSSQCLDSPILRYRTNKISLRNS